MAGRVIYVGGEFQVPLGGIRIVTEHVALLVAAGVDAYRWSPTPGFRYTWFEEDVPTLSGMEIDLTAEDMLIVPEISVLPHRDPAPGGRKVIFNQAYFLTFVACPDVDLYPGWTTDPAVWTVSQESAEVLGRAVPRLPPQLVPNPIDTEMFAPAGRRVPSIAWMARKRAGESVLLNRILRNDPRSEGVELREIRGLSHAEVAEVLSTTSVFIAMGSPEGESFGLPIAEALASGCLVTGYSSGGGGELFEAPSAWQVPDLRPAMAADRALELLRLPDDEPVRAAGRQWLKERYSAEATTAALLRAVEATRAMPGAAARATHPFAWEAEEIQPFFAAARASLEAAEVSG
jgi:glycosyltransferase involved in cell wall biosynthesis